MIKSGLRDEIPTAVTLPSETQRVLFKSYAPRLPTQRMHPWVSRPFPDVG